MTATGQSVVFVPNSDGSKLVRDRKTKGPLTVQGELDKLAANISIGRNMAGVHYYSDYYDSARMGERIAIGILLEQAPTYGDAVETTPEVIRRRLPDAVRRSRQLPVAVDHGSPRHTGVAARLVAAPCQR